MIYALMGDLHGSPQIIVKELQKGVPIIHLGDIGNEKDLQSFLNIPRDEFMLIQGNHDDTKVARKIPGYLGDFGEFVNGVGFVRGAYSIDKLSQMMQNTFYEDEELSEKEIEAFLDWYEKAKPEIMLSHDVPSRVQKELHSQHIKNKTGDFLDIAYQVHKPKKWYAGHHHVSRTLRDNHCEFNLLGVNEVLYVDL